MGKKLAESKLRHGRKSKPRGGGIKWDSIIYTPANHISSDGDIEDGEMTNVSFLVDDKSGSFSAS